MKPKKRKFYINKSRSWLDSKSWVNSWSNSWIFSWFKSWPGSCSWAKSKLYPESWK